MNDTVRSASRVLDLLEHLAASPGGVTLTECVSAMQIPKSSMSMLLKTVVARGYAIKDENDRFRLNDDFLDHGFGWGGHRTKRMIAIASPIMIELAKDLGETILLSCAGSSGVRTLHKVLPDEIVRYDDPGTVQAPFYCTAIGRLILAHVADQERDDILNRSVITAYTAKTITDIEQIKQIIIATKGQRYSVVIDEYADGGTGVAFPIATTSGDLLAVLNAGVVSSRFEQKKEKIFGALETATNRIAAALTYKSQR